MIWFYMCFVNKILPLHIQCITASTIVHIADLCRSVNQTTRQLVDLSTWRSVDLSTVDLSTFDLSTCRIVNLSTRQPVDLSACGCDYLSPVDMSQTFKTSLRILYLHMTCSSFTIHKDICQNGVEIQRMNINVPAQKILPELLICILLLNWCTLNYLDRYF